MDDLAILKDTIEERRKREDFATPQDRFERALKKLAGEALSPAEAAEQKRRQQEADLVRKRDDEFRAKKESEQRWHDLIEARGPRYGDARLGNFEIYDDRQKHAIERLHEFCDHMPKQHAEGRGLVFFGPCGTGKDHLLVAALREATQTHGMRAVWINGMELFGLLRDAIGADREESSVLRKYITADLLAISDPLPPFGGLTEYQATMLFRIIDGRYSRMLPTWATINVKDGAEAVDRMGAQIVERLRHGAVQIHCNWDSYRKAAK